MHLYRFDAETGREIQDGARDAVISRVVAAAPDAHVSVIHVRPRGLIAFHHAASDQLFLVVQGAGWVAGPDRVRVDIASGHAALWRCGEWHESGSDQGMTVFVIEAAAIDPLLPPL